MICWSDVTAAAVQWLVLVHGVAVVILAMVGVLATIFWGAELVAAKMTGLPQRAQNRIDYIVSRGFLLLLAFGMVGSVGTAALIEAQDERRTPMCEAACAEIGLKYETRTVQDGKITCECVEADPYRAEVEIEDDCGE